MIAQYRIGIAQYLEPLQLLHNRIRPFFLYSNHKVVCWRVEDRRSLEQALETEMSWFTRACSTKACSLHEDDSEVRLLNIAAVKFVHRC